MDEVFNQLNIQSEYRTGNLNTFIEGRCTAVYVEGLLMGYAGEVSPKVLENLGLYMPVAAFEIFLEPLLKLRK